MKSRMTTVRLASGALFALAVLPLGVSPPAGQAQGRPSTAAIPGISRQPSEAARKALLDPNDTVLLLLDHQAGLFQTVKDVPVQELRANAVVLAKAAELAKVPILTTASEPGGPNGPLMSELAAAAPSAKYVPRKGEISAWDNDDFVKAVEATGRKTLVIAGVWTSVCVAFPALPPPTRSTRESVRCAARAGSARRSDRRRRAGFATRPRQQGEPLPPRHGPGAERALGRGPRAL